MKIRSILLFLGLCFVAATVCLAGDVFMGTWTLNETKSKIDSGMTRNTWVVYKAVGDSVKVIVDGVDPAGKRVHNEWTGKYDGKDYPIVGDMTADSRSYKMVDDHTLTLINKKDGKVVAEGTIVVSPDGKTRTFTGNGTDARGNKISQTAVYDKLQGKGMREDFPEEVE